MQKKELWLVWQDPKTRLRHVIGKLWFKKGLYYYAYDTSNLKKAMNGSFSLHQAFPDPNKVYKSETLFPAFKLRLPNKRRPDYLELLKEYDLNDTSSDLEILSATAGRLATDNYEFVPTLSNCETLDFYLAGWRHWNGNAVSHQDLQPGTLLDIVPEEENKYDKFALQVYTTSKVKIGYVPAFYSRIVYDQLAKNGFKYELTVLSFNPDKEPSIILKLRLVYS